MEKLDFHLKVPVVLYDSFTPIVCEKLFNSICVMTPAPHMQLYTVALLAKMAGHQPWWGNFLANALINLYSASSTHIFPQDRLVSIPYPLLPQLYFSFFIVKLFSGYSFY